MPQDPTAEAPEAVLATLSEALDLVDFGIVLLDRAARICWYTVPSDELSAYLDRREAAVRAGAAAPTEIDLNDGRRMLFRCITCPDGGRMLTYTDVTRVKQEQELQHHARDEAERIGVELHFSNQTLESQASYLASLVEAAEDSAQRTEEARATARARGCRAA